MRNVIIGTAGHIDHGKTCLIQALTGIDTDRLKEEKQRGITIELGFADLPNDRGLDIGIIDVPGHEKFIRHMLAGIGGIDLVLLVVAADEGFMPQTIEHFGIIKMLGISKGIVVITKIDMVDKEWLEIIREDIQDHVTGTFLENAPVIEVSSRTGEGIESLKECILSLASQCGGRYEDPELLRLPIDRVFTISGFGTVVTGTLLEGSVRLGDEVTLYPSELKAKVRNLQIHGVDTLQAKAGQRTAINLTGIKKEDICRGHVISRSGSLENTYMLDVRIDMFDQTRRTLKNGSRVHFYCGTAELLCKVVLLDTEALSEGQTGFAQLRFEEPVAVRNTDRFILRFYSPMETIGGGIILDATAKKKKRFDRKALQSLMERDSGDEKRMLSEQFLQQSRSLSTREEVLRKSSLPREKAEAITEELISDGSIISVSDTLLLHKDFIQELKEKTEQNLNEYHENNPLIEGIAKEEFRKKLFGILHIEDRKKTEQLIAFFLREHVIKERSGYISLNSFQVEYTEKQKEIEDQVIRIYEDAGFEMPTTEEVALRWKDRKMILQIITNLNSCGVLVRIAPEYLIHRASLADGLQMLTDTLKKKGTITLGEFRDLLGTSRKYAELILIYTDNIGMTRMEEDHRVLISK